LPLTVAAIQEAVEPPIERALRLIERASLHVGRDEMRPSRTDFIRLAGLHGSPMLREDAVIDAIMVTLDNNANLPHVAV